VKAKASSHKPAEAGCPEFIGFHPQINLGLSAEVKMRRLVSARCDKITLKFNGLEAQWKGEPAMEKSNTNLTRPTIGIDLGDRSHRYCILLPDGKIQEESSVSNTAEAISRMFQDLPACRVAMEAGTHSVWISKMLTEMGQEVLVGNPRELHPIYKSKKKTDKRDARMLARMARVDSEMLHPIQHRSMEGQVDLAMVKARDVLVGCRTQMINYARSIVKTIGERLPSSSADAFATMARKHVPPSLKAVLDPVIQSIDDMTHRIKAYETELEEMAKTKYPFSEALDAICGIGLITAITFILLIEDPRRFERSRQVGDFFGLCPANDQSGDQNKQCHISKEGSHLMRRLLVQCAHYMLGRNGPDSDLRRWGLALAARGGKAAKKRAAVAVARRLAVIMHRMWMSGEPYDPFYISDRKNRNKEASCPKKDNPSKDRKKKPAETGQGALRKPLNQRARSRQGQAAAQ
jgi:transposase